MQTTVIVSIIGGSFALVGAALGAVLNRWTSLSTAREIAKSERLKYTQDRLWDCRKESYTTILACLKETSKFADLVRDGYHDDEMPAEGYHSSDERRSQETALWKSWEACKADFEKNRLLLSQKFVTEFQYLLDSLAAVDKYNLPPDVAWDNARCFSAAHPRLLAIARGEIAPSALDATTA